MKRIAFVIFSVIISTLFSCHEKHGKANEISSGERVMDSAGLLTVDQRNVLNDSIRKFEEEIGSRLAIVIVDTLGAKNINEVSLAIGEKLKLGRQKYRDGVLIFVAYKDRKTRIEVGYGLERIIRDEIAKRIIREKMAPRFKKQEYYEGLSAAIAEISELIRANKQLIGKP